MLQRTTIGKRVEAVVAALAPVGDERSDEGEGGDELPDEGEAGQGVGAAGAQRPESEQAAGGGLRRVM
jgi:hypothetical protein